MTKQEVKTMMSALMNTVPSALCYAISCDRCFMNNLLVESHGLEILVT